MWSSFAAWASLAMLVDLNDGKWSPDAPDTDDAVRTMVAIAAGEVDESGPRNGSVNESDSGTDSLPV